MSKTCTKCKVEKPVTEYRKDARGKDGLHYRCKNCQKEQERARRKMLASRETIEYPETKVCSTCKERKLHTEFYKSRNRGDGLTSKCKVCREVTSLEYVNTPNGRAVKQLRRYKHADKVRNIKCDLTKQWIVDNIASKPYIYCGDTSQVGCDRIDNSKGHTKDNVVPCCYICNTARMDNFTHTEMFIIGGAIKQVKKARNSNNGVN